MPTIRNVVEEEERIKKTKKKWNENKLGNETTKQMRK